ncbi:Lrp/AsnC ligand binding domain protein [uncultured archaeon]|nr:Lrp/AsnC ligand binding domain protein [uncultured archaeon]
MQKSVEPTAIRYAESAYMLINCELGSEGSILEQLKLLPGIEEAIGVFGNYDIVVKIQAPSLELLREIVTFKIRKIPKIYYTTTIMCSKLLV